MTILQTMLLLFVAAGATAVVLNREPARQAVVMSLYGLVLASWFLVIQAPDVAYSQLVVGSAVVPFILLVAVSRTRKRPN